MKRFLARLCAQLLVGLCGAALVAIALSAIGEAKPQNLPEYLTALLAKLAAFGKGDAGRSLISGLPVQAELAQQLPPTLALIGAGAGVALLTGIPLGLLFAFGSIRRAIAPFLQFATATPVFCAGLALAYGAVQLLHWPVSVNMRAGSTVLADEAWRYAALPIATVGLAGAAAVQLALRQAAIRASNEAFCIGLKRLGLSLWEIELLYVLPQIFAGLLARAGEITLALLSAAVVAEWVFHRQGAADLFVKSVALADWNMTAVILFVFAALTILTNFAGRLAGYLLVREDLA